MLPLAKTPGTTERVARGTCHIIYRGRRGNVAHDTFFNTQDATHTLGTNLQSDFLFSAKRRGECCMCKRPSDTSMYGERSRRRRDFPKSPHDFPFVCAVPLPLRSTEEVHLFGGTILTGGAVYYYQYNPPYLTMKTHQNTKHQNRQP